MATPNIVPRADSEGQLGTSSKYWAAAYIDLIYLGAGKVGRDADNLIDFSVDDAIFFRVNGSKRVMLNGSRLAPDTTDALQLGGTSNMWSDLFLASGAVINFDNSDVTLTHSSNRLTLADDDQLSFGNGDDFNFSWNGTNGHIKNETSDTGSHIYISNYSNDGDIVLRSDDGSGGLTEYLTLDGSTTSTLFHKNTFHVDGVQAIFGTGGDLGIQHDGSNSYIAHGGTGNLIIRQNTNDADIIFDCDDGSGGLATYLTLDGGAGYTIANKTIAVVDGQALALGTGLDLQINHDGTNSYVNNTNGKLFINNQTNNSDIVFRCDDGAGGVATYFSLDGSSAAHDGSATTALFTNFPDKSHLSFGTSHDLQIDHDGNHSVIYNQTGHLYISNDSNDGDIILRSDDGSGGVTAYLTLDGGAVRTISSQHISMNDGKALYVGDGLDAGFYHSGGNNFLETNSGNLTIVQNTDDGDIIFQSDDGSGGVATYFYLDGSSAAHNGSATTALFTNWPDNSYISLGTSHDLQIVHTGVNSVIQNLVGKLQILSFTDDIEIKQFGDDKDIILSSDDGSGGVTPYLTLDGSGLQTISHKHILFADNAKARFGGAADLEIYHDGSDSYLQNSTGNLIIKNTTHAGDIIFQTESSSGTLATYFQIDGGITKTTFSKDTKHFDSVKGIFGTNDDLQIYHDGSNSYISDQGTGNLIVRATNLQFQNNGGSSNYLEMFNGGTTQIMFAGSTKFATTATGIAVTGGVTSTSATGNAAGAGFNTANTVAINVGEINGEIITTIKVDLGTGAIVSSGTAGDVIGEDDTEGAFLTRITTAVNGIVYRGEMICVEVPTTGDPDINLAANSSATLAEDGAGEGEHVLINGGTATLAKHYPSFTIPSGGIQNDHLYLTHGGTTAGTYGAGQFIIKLYGAAVVS